MLQIIFLYYTLPVSKVIMSTRTDQYDTIQIMFLYRVANLPVRLRIHCTLCTLSSFWQVHTCSVCSLPPSCPPSCSLSFPRLHPGQGQGGRLCMHMAQGGCFVSELPNHVCTRELPPECIETKGMSLEQASEHWPQPIRSQATLSFLQVRTGEPLIIAGEWVM